MPQNLKNRCASRLIVSNLVIESSSKKKKLTPWKLKIVRPEKKLPSQQAKQVLQKASCDFRSELQLCSRRDKYKTTNFLQASVLCFLKLGFNKNIGVRNSTKESSTQIVKLDHLPRDWAEQTKCLKPPRSQFMVCSSRFG